MAFLAGVQGDILVTSPPSVALGGPVAYTDSGDHTNYTINDATKRYLDPNVAVTVQTSPDGVTWSTVTNYTIQYVGGKIIFNTANASGTQVRLNAGNYYPYASVGNTTDWLWQGTKNMADATTHKGVGGSTWQDFQPLLTTGKVTLKKWWFNQTMVNHLVAGDLLVISCVAPSGNRYEAFAYVSQSQLDIAVSKLVEDNLTFQLTGALYQV
jgi:hypothetical protein